MLPVPLLGMACCSICKCKQVPRFGQLRNSSAFLLSFGSCPVKCRLLDTVSRTQQHDRLRGMPTDKCTWCVQSLQAAILTGFTKMTKSINQPIFLLSVHVILYVYLDRQPSQSFDWGLGEKDVHGSDFTALGPSFSLRIPIGSQCKWPSRMHMQAYRSKVIF